MKRIRWSSVALLLLGCWSLLAAERPNILLIVSEDNGPELGCYGDPYVQTPVLDRLAADGVRFENAFVPQAGCSQSRAALLTGLYPHQNGQIGLATWKFHMYREDTPNLVRSLNAVGYRTGIIGKLHINPAKAFPFDVHHIPRSNFARKDLAAYATHAADFMESDEEPFFLSVNYPDPHRPFVRQVDGLPTKPLAPDEVKSLPYFGFDSPELREQTADYYNCMSRLDSLIGDLLLALKKSGKADNTLVIYLGDHGADLLRGKRTSYEGGLRVPMIVRWPNKIVASQVRKELVSTLDILPTILRVADAPEIENLPGRSLISLLQNQDEAAAWRSHLFTEYHTHSAHNYFPQRTVRDRRFKLIHNLLPNSVNPGYAFTLRKFFPKLQRQIDSASTEVRDAYARMKQPPEFELYDLSADPFEFRNLATDSSYAQQLQSLKAKLDEWRRATNDPLLNAENVLRLKAEIDACRVGDSFEKSKLQLTYERYFFSR